MQINIANGNSIINASQNGDKNIVTSDTRKNQLERRIKMLKKHLLENDCDEETTASMNEQIADYEKELSQLN